ncbi:conserved hypothetical protein [Hyella patelloides LEGE 07179]|uniref:Uncharacterized protein n=1 Tax=Hyella patelloides LEGE 07179 TaxID=945734 RepID=A0A563VKL0_9CYAN|nr:DUF6439 family protein [Hyella patelloides]VEP11873.1 conserved hypothetical protein [Hyella patelloides LEGE 07179]
MSETTKASPAEQLQDITTLELAQELAQRLAISHRDWHRLQGDRKAQAGQQLASAMIFLLKDKPELALNHLQQATGWLDKSLKAPGCPDKK